MKGSFRIWLVGKGHVVMVNLCIDGAPGGAVVLMPRAVKRTPAPKRNERPKLGDRDL